MRTRISAMTIVPPAGVLPTPAAIQPVRYLFARSCQDRRAINGQPKSDESAPKSAVNWLFAEDEYFPFDADTFEER